jgi:hypothetical protein
LVDSVVPERRPASVASVGRQGNITFLIAAIAAGQ